MDSKLKLGYEPRHSREGFLDERRGCLRLPLLIANILQIFAGVGVIWTMVAEPISGWYAAAALSIVFSLPLSLGVFAILVCLHETWKHRDFGLWLTSWLVQCMVFVLMLLMFFLIACSTLVKS
jgi:F0F1-type ATP synthase membrane subunit a